MRGSARGYLENVALPPFPDRLFLDSNTLQALLDHGGAIFELLFWLIRLVFWYPAIGLPIIGLVVGYVIYSAYRQQQNREQRVLRHLELHPVTPLRRFVAQPRFYHRPRKRCPTRPCAAVRWAHAGDRRRIMGGGRLSPLALTLA